MSASTYILPVHGRHPDVFLRYPHGRISIISLHPARPLLPSALRNCTKAFCSSCVVTDFSLPVKNIFEDDPVCKACVQRFNHSKIHGGSFSGESGVLPSNLDALFEEFMEERQIKPAAREQMRLKDKGMKWNMLQAHRAQAREAATRENNDPSYWVQLLTTAGKRGEHDAVDRLCAQLRSQTRTWMGKFLESGGFVELIDIIQAAKTKELKISCLNAFMLIVTTELGLEKFLQLPELIQPLAFMLMFSQEEPIRILLLQVFSFVCGANQEVGYPRVYDALRSSQLGRIPFKVGW